MFDFDESISAESEIAAPASTVWEQIIKPGGVVDLNFLLLTGEEAILTETRFHTSFIIKKAYDFFIFNRIILTSVSSWTRCACPKWVFKGMGRKA